MRRKSLYWDRWIYPLTKDVDTTFSTAVCAELSKSGPVSEKLFSLYQSRMIKELVEFEVDHSTPLDDFRSAVQIQALFKKNLDIDMGYNPLHEAWKAFIQAELHCLETDKYFGRPSPLPGINRAIQLARQRIKEVLGTVPTLKRLSPRFGPGASTLIKRSHACFENKLSGPLVCSEDMFPKVHDFLEETPGWAAAHSASYGRSVYRDENPPSVDWHCEGLSLILDTGTLSFVPKNAKTHRPIVVEPQLNGFWQLGVGGYIRDRLRVRANQDLRDQQRNRDLAREGSITGGLATIDLSSASDTIAFSVVFDLLPEDWVDLLSSLRTSRISYEGHEYELEKFSSMGNGFTFELESLIFWALSSACTEIRGGDQKKVSVYGDDIIVPTDVVELLRVVLHWCGFKVNNQKSFWRGPFRESCGADWLQGEDVRPIFKKDRVSLQWLYTFHNWALRRGLINLSSIARSFIPNDFQFYGPDGYGDGHLLGSYELKKPRTIKRRGWEGGYFSTLREKSRVVPVNHDQDFLYGLYDLYNQGPTNLWDPRSSRPRGVAPGTSGVELTSLYTFAEHIFVR